MLRVGEKGETVSQAQCIHEGHPDLHRIPLHGHRKRSRDHGIGTFSLYKAFAHIQIGNEPKYRTYFNQSIEEAHELGIFTQQQARRTGRAWYFESRKAWRTVAKAALVLTAIAMAWLLDTCVLDFLQLNVARLFAGFTCGVELWSFLENAAQLSDAPFFLRMRRYVRRRIGKEVGDE